MGARVIDDSSSDDMTMSLSMDRDSGKCLLSLLIPAYEHPLGVSRILDRLYASNAAGVECLISDDSVSDVVEVAVLRHPAYQNGMVDYVHNIKSNGAVENWNSLISRAKGEYILLMHHDECPETDKFFAELCAIVSESNDHDVLLLECLLPTRGGSRLRNHVPYALRVLYMRLGPEHLLLHNTLGSPSTIVVRRSSCLEFDADLKWLVDVEWMVRLLRQPSVKYIFIRELAVVSLFNEQTSITESIKTKIPELRAEELSRISKRQGSRTLLNILIYDGSKKTILGHVEYLAWILLRSVTRTTAWLTARPLPLWIGQRR